MMRLRIGVLLGGLVWASQVMATATTGTYTFTYSTFARAGLGTPVQIVDNLTTFSFRLGEENFDKTIVLTGGARPIAFVPPEVTVSGVTLAIPNNVQPKTVTLVTEQGRSLRLANPRAVEALELRTVEGATLNATAVTYSAETGSLTLAAGDTVTLDFSEAAAEGVKIGTLCVVAAGAPHLRVEGKATVTRHILTIDGKEAGLDALLKAETGYEDAGDHIIVAEFAGAGGSLAIDRSISASPLVLGSVVPADQAEVHFLGKNGAGEAVTFSAPLTLRDGEDETGELTGARGGVSLFGPSEGVVPLSVFNPSAFLLQCDATLRTPLPYDADGVTGWFRSHDVVIPTGRTLRLQFDTTVTDQEGQLPNVAFEAPTSCLELASNVGGAAIPKKYLEVLGKQSGTLSIDRDVTVTGQVTLQAKAAGLETTLILKSGTFSAQGISFTDEADGEVTGSFAAANVLLEGGTLSLSGDLVLCATEAAVVVGEGSALTTTAIGPFATGTSTDVTIEQGGTLTLTDSLGGALTADELGGLDLRVRGTLALQGVSYFQLLPATRRTLYLEGGTIAAQGDVLTDIVCGLDEGGTEAIDVMRVSGGGTLSGNLTVDGVSGAGTLTLGAGVTVKHLRDYDGTVEGTGSIGVIEGARGEVILGGDWLTGGKTLAYLAEIAPAYRGTIGFTAGTEAARKEVNFSDVAAFSTLGMAFRVADNQHIVMRLDQYADATIRWPSNPTNVTLTLIESGAYGGEVEIPHIPAGVTLDFRAFPEAGGSATVGKGDFTLTANEDGVKDTLTWENPTFSGAGAWFDVEFNGTSANIGWFTLRNQSGTAVANGMLRGDTDDAGQVVMTDSNLFVPVAHPADDHGGLPLRYCPYVSTDSLAYPDVWSVAVRLTAPAAAKTCILALGGNYKEGDATDETFALVFATGDTANEIVLWKFDGVGAAAVPAADEEPLFRVTLAEAQEALHLFSVVCDGQALTLYMDGAYLNQIDLPEGTRLAPGLQVGRQLGGTSRPAGITDFAQDVSDTAGGVIDYIRFYKGALSDAAMQEMADRTPYVRENLRYVRYVPITTAPEGFTKAVPEGGETWVQEGAWREERYADGAWATSGYADQPAEGSIVTLLVDEGTHTIQVNVARDEAQRFYSPNRNYATLAVVPQLGNAAAGTLHLTPYGVTADERDDTPLNDQPWEKQVLASKWYTTKADASAANRTGFHYGRIRFTGGAEDAFTDDDRIDAFYGAGYLLSNLQGATRTESEPVPVGDIVWQAESALTEENRTQTASGLGWAQGTATRTGTRTFEYTVTTVTADDGASVNGYYDAGVCYFSKYATMNLVAPGTTVQTMRRTVTYEQTGTYERDWLGRFTYEWDDPPAEGWPVVNPGTETAYGEPTAGTTSEQLNSLRLVAGMSLTRGVVDEVARWQLTGPVIVGGRVYDDRVQGHDNLPDDQASEDVWVPYFTANSTWKFYDDTRIEANGGMENMNGALNGLFARCVQTPGRLYLDFTVGQDGTAEGEAKAAEGLFSAQKWFRYGYEGNAGSADTLSGMPPAQAEPTDFDQAVAFQIRLSRKTGNVALTIDKHPKSDVQTFYVEEEANPPEHPLTLSLTTAEGVDPLPIHRTVIAAARLDVSNGQNADKVPGEASHEGNALNLRPDEGLHTPVHRGPDTVGRGAYIVGHTVVDWDFGKESSVAALEVAPGCELTFLTGQDFRGYGTTLVAHEGAWIHHTSAAPFLGRDVALHAGAVFAFHAEAASTGANLASEGVVLEGNLTLRGSATLRADQAASDGRLPHFTASAIVAEPLVAEPIEADADALTLTVHAPEGVTWHSHTGTLTGAPLGLTKTGPGTVDFYLQTPPTVTGVVSVDEGELRVAMANDTPIGQYGLHVAKGAVLADNGLMQGNVSTLARIPNGQTLSGTGTLRGGRLRLEQGAAYIVDDKGGALTAEGGIETDNVEGANILAHLPEGYAKDTPFLVSGRAERTVRRRLRSLQGESRWDTVAYIEGGRTFYAARPAGIPAPTDYEGYTPDDPRNAYDATLHGSLVDHYQGNGVAYVGATQGRTQDATKRLTAAEVSDVLYAFSGVYALLPASAQTEEGREWIDASNLYVAYEFGIDAMAFAQIDGKEHAVVRLRVRNALKEAFAGQIDTTAAAVNAEADFRATAELGLTDAQGQPLDCAFEVADLAGTPLPASEEVALHAARTPGVRYLALPVEAVPEDGLIKAQALPSEPRAR